MSSKSKTEAKPAAKKAGTPKTPKQPKAPKPEAETPVAVAEPAAPVDPKTATLGQLTDAYVRAIEDQGHSPSTCRGYKGELHMAEEAIGENTPVASITVEQVARFYKSDPVVKTRDGLPKAQLGVDKTRRVLRLALVWAVQQGWIETAPLPEPVKS